MALLKIESGSGFVRFTHDTGIIETFPKNELHMRRNGDEFWFFLYGQNQTVIKTAFGLVDPTTPVHVSANALQTAIEGIIYAV